MSSITSLDLSHLFIENIFSKHGLPSSIVSDRGSLFVSSFWTNLCQQLKTSRDLSTAYHPETDGETERVNQILEQYLWIPTKKLSETWLGPFPILKKIGTHIYHLKLPSQWKSIHPVFHISLLEPVKTSTIPNRHQEPPPPIIIEKEEEWEVSQILDSKFKRIKLWYLVEWKGFSKDPERSTWKPAKNLKNCLKLVKDLHSLYPDKPGPNSSRA
ncbi:hypothetical protein O181_054261 [Austropuccinia psidii MF-1]|uniref:Chromo domain-containing protein n=1 Tax=Austropuccinia psidii MF-1 TaxID=1389203 RepID=A0A9Q3E265_9BASI|nr:hypothetical protein [Austropuccinia psidii MF-1]